MKKKKIKRAQIFNAKTNNPPPPPPKKKRKKIAKLKYLVVENSKLKIN